MEIKEFSSVAEAIKALNNIKNIDYSTLDGADEVSEREFYNALMNNLMGTKKLKFTKEERENYKAALRKKGLLTYKEWKQRQPNSEEQTTWKDSVEQGSLDAPVNLFSHLLNSEDEKKFEYITNVTTKTVLGSDWTKNNEKIMEQLKKEAAQKQEEKIIEETNQELAQKVNEILEEEKKEVKVQEQKVEPVEEVAVELEVEEPKVEEVVFDTSEQEFKEKLESFKFSTPEEAIEALNSIERFEYKKGHEPDALKEKEFYSKIMKNLVACDNLKFDDTQAYMYQRALQELGCKPRNVLGKYRNIDDNVSVPEEYINAILQSTRSDHHQAFKAAKFKAKNNEELNEWIENAQKEIETQTLEKNDEEKSLEPYKKPSLFKKVKTYAAIAAASIATLFGAAKKTEAYSDNVYDNTPKAESVDLNKEDDKLKANLEGMGVKTLADELNEYVNEHAKIEDVKKETVSKEADKIYQKAPETNAEVYGKANEEAMQQARENDKEEEKVKQAKEEAAKEAIEIVIEPETVTRQEDKSDSVIVGVEDTGTIEEKETVDSNEIVVEITDNGTVVEEKKAVPASETKKSEENKDKKEVVEVKVDEQGREIIEVEIDF